MFPARCLPISSASSISSISFVSLAHRPAPSDETSDEQAKRRTRRAIGNGEAEHHDIRFIRTTPMPLHAIRIAHTSRITHESRHEHANGKTPPSKPLTTPLTGRRAGRQRDDKRDAHASPACLPTRRQRNAERHGNCYPPHDTTARDERDGMKGETTSRTNDGTKKNGPPLLNEKRPEKRDEIYN